MGTGIGGSRGGRMGRLKGGADRVVSFDAQAARESLHFMGEALREIGDGFIVVGGGQACVSG